MSGWQASLLIIVLILSVWLKSYLLPRARFVADFQKPALSALVDSGFVMLLTLTVSAWCSTIASAWYSMTKPPPSILCAGLASTESWVSTSNLWTAKIARTCVLTVSAWYSRSVSAWLSRSNQPSEPILLTLLPAAMHYMTSVFDSRPDPGAEGSIRSSGLLLLFPRLRRPMPISVFRSKNGTTTHTECKTERRAYKHWLLLLIMSAIGSANAIIWSPFRLSFYWARIMLASTIQFVTSCAHWLVSTPCCLLIRCLLYAKLVFDWLICSWKSPSIDRLR